MWIYITGMGMGRTFCGDGCHLYHRAALLVYAVRKRVENHSQQRVVASPSADSLRW